MSVRGYNWDTLMRNMAHCLCTNLNVGLQKLQLERMQNTKQLPFYHPDSVALPSPCSPWSPPSSAGRCRSAGQWLARHSCPCTPRAHQSRASCCPRSLPPGRTCHRISASAWRGCQSPCSWRRLALLRRSTCLAGVGRGGLWGFSGSSSTDAQSLSCL